MSRLILPFLLSSLLLGSVQAHSSVVVAQAPISTTTPGVTSLDRILNSIVSISTVQPMGAAEPSSRGWSPLPSVLLPWLGTGTGVLVSDQEVLTSARLVQGNTTVSVTARGGASVPARVVGIYPDHDVALLRLNRQLSGALRPAPLGNSDRLTPGQQLTVVGLSPSGGFSAQEVRIRSAAKGELTLDTAPNATTRGGPLINAAGEVVGLVSGRFGLRLDLPFASGVQGAAVPINAATSVLPDLRASKAPLAKRAPVARQPVQLGVQVIDLAQVPAQQRRGMNWPDSGLLVQSVVPGSPAAQAGLQGGRRTQRVGNQTLQVDGDVIVAVDGKPVRRFEEFRQVIAAQAPTSRVVLEILRAGRSQPVTVTLARPPSQ